MAKTTLCTSPAFEPDEAIYEPSVQQALLQCCHFWDPVAAAIDSDAVPGGTIWFVLS